MKKSEFRNMGLDSACEYVNERELMNSDLQSRENLHNYAVDQLGSADNCHINLSGYNCASNAINALAESDADWFRYDMSMGTLETPTPIESIDDLIDILEEYLDFEPEAEYGEHDI